MRDCESCKNHTDKGCTKWKCEFEPTTKNDLALINTYGLDEEIRCTMCTNHMKGDSGCDGSCVVNEDMYKAVMDAIEKRIQPTTKNDLGVDREDAVERLNALKQFIGYDKDSEIVKATQKSLDMAIKALEQEPILDKIRAEIHATAEMHEDGEYYLRDEWIDEIIDKYKAESEDKE